MNAAASSMLEILVYIEAELARGARTLTLDVLDPDLATSRYAGERVDGLIHRPLRMWIDLAERLRLRMRTPQRIDDRMLRLTFERLAVNDAPDTSGTEKYGAASEFARIRKLEDPRFVIDLRESLGRVVESFRVGADATTNTQVGTKTKTHVGTTSEVVASARTLRVLDLGVNTGDELLLILQADGLRDAEIVGVDHSASAIAVARERFANRPNVRLVEADITKLSAHAGSRPLAEHAAMPDTAPLGRFDLVVCIGTLQSGALDDRELLRAIVQDHLAPGGAVILGMPNCRYVDGELEYGARIVNITQPELGLLVKDVAFYRKYLQQHHKKVFVTGKHYILVTAVAT